MEFCVISAKAVIEKQYKSIKKPYKEVQSKVMQPNLEV